MGYSARCTSVLARTDFFVRCFLLAIDGRGCVLGSGAMVLGFFLEHRILPLLQRVLLEPVL